MQDCNQPEQELELVADQKVTLQKQFLNWYFCALYTKMSRNVPKIFISLLD